MIKKGEEAGKKIPYLPSGEKVEGVLYKTLAVSEKMMVTVWYLDKDAVVPHHYHPHEQVGYVVSGEIMIDIDSNSANLKSGDTYAIPGGSSHSVTVVSDSLVIDVFSPPREDYRD